MQIHVRLGRLWHRSSICGFYDKFFLKLAFLVDGRFINGCLLIPIEDLQENGQA